MVLKLVQHACMKVQAKPPHGVMQSHQKVNYKGDIQCMPQ